MTVTVCWAVKGGSGATVVAACLALSRSTPQLLVDLDGEQPATLGLPEPAGQGLCDWFATDLPPDAVDDLAVDVDRTTRLVPRGTGRIAPDAERWVELVSWWAGSSIDVVVDAGTGPLPPVMADRPAGVRLLLVTRACFLALRRAAHSGQRPDGVVLVAEPGRALRRRDVEHAVGAPVVATLGLDPLLARAVDAGLLQSRRPRFAARALAAIDHSRAPARPDRLRLAR